MLQSPLLDPHHYPANSVTVLIGANGSGKSRHLREICLRSLRRGENVVAVSPSPYDRFGGIRNSSFQFFGSRLGPRAIRRMMSSLILRASTGDPKVLSNFTRALEHTGFDAAIGIRVPELPTDKLQRMLQEKEPLAVELARALERWGDRSSSNGIVALRIQSYSFTELHALNIGFIVRHEARLPSLGIKGKIEYFFIRGGEPIPLLEACSGEIAYVTTFAFIAAQITPRAIIAIDEPETSLHPTWQKGYVSMLLDLFSLFEPRIFISTHSPIIISGAQTTEHAVTVLEAAPSSIRLFQHQRLSLEEMYDRLFHIITPKNHHLSNRAVSLLNDLSAGNRSLANVQESLKRLRERSYDGRQREAISKIEELARRVSSARK